MAKGWRRYQGRHSHYIRLTPLGLYHQPKGLGRVSLRVYCAVRTVVTTYHFERTIRGAGHTERTGEARYTVQIHKNYILQLPRSETMDDLSEAM